MTRAGRSTASAALIALAIVLFVPAFAQAANGFSAPGWEYAEYVQLVLNNVPVLLAAGVVLVLGTVALEVAG